MAIYIQFNWFNSSSIVGDGAGALFKKRITGADLDTAHRWQIAGTDLGIPYVLENGAIGFLFGDTFSSAWPEEGHGWRSPVMLRSHSLPGGTTGIVWDNAARVATNGFAPALFAKHANDVTFIPNDGISFPETKRQIVSFMGIERCYNAPAERGARWKSRYAGLAYTDNGNDFIRANIEFHNTADNSDPFQMWSMQRDGQWVYIYSVRSGRQSGPMMLRRVNWEHLFSAKEYQCWGKKGDQWDWGNPCTGLFEGNIGEPSVRKLSDGTWVMAYLNDKTGSIVTWKASSPTGPWSGEKVQVTQQQEANCYGGFIHPWSTSKPGDLHLMVSTWKHDLHGKSTAYHVSQWVASV